MGYNSRYMERICFAQAFVEFDKIWPGENRVNRTHDGANETEGEETTLPPTEEEELDGEALPEVSASKYVHHLVFLDYL